jgi:hypothetical protein
LLTAGVMLPLSLAPGWMRAMAHANPLYYAVEAGRDLAAGTIGTNAVALAFKRPLKTSADPPGPDGSGCPREGRFGASTEPSRRRKHCLGHYTGRADGAPPNTRPRAR